MGMNDSHVQLNFKAKEFGAHFHWGVGIAAAHKEGAWNLGGREDTI